MHLRQAIEGLASKQVEVSHLRDEFASSAHCGASMSWVNSNRYVAEEVVSTAIKLVQPTRLSFHEQVLGLSTRGDGTWHSLWGCGSLYHCPPSPLAEGGSMCDGARVFVEGGNAQERDIGQLLPNFSAAANTVVVVLSVEQVIKDTLIEGRPCWFCFSSKEVSE